MRKTVALALTAALTLVLSYLLFRKLPDFVFAFYR